MAVDSPSSVVNGDSIVLLTSYDSPILSAERELHLTESFSSLLPNLKPPFTLQLLSHHQHSETVKALLFGILTQPNLAKTHFTHLAAIVTDGYELFVQSLLKLVDDSYPKFSGVARSQLIWACDKMISVEATGIENLLVSLLRRIVPGDFNEVNLWLASEFLQQIVKPNWDWILNQKFILGSALYVYLRLVADHAAVSFPGIDSLRWNEMEFCIRVLRDHLGQSLCIGRDLVRLLRELDFIPPFRDLWKDLDRNPGQFSVSEFSDVSQIYQVKTPKRYLTLTINQEMEKQMAFLLTKVNWGNQKRYQCWFADKFLFSPERETVIPDLIRYIVSFIPRSSSSSSSSSMKIISRWAVVGWLIKFSGQSRRFHVKAMSALFYDWMFYDEKVDGIMSIEPAMLLMLNSVSDYAEITVMLLEFLLSAMENYDVRRKDMVSNGVRASFGVLVARLGLVTSSSSSLDSLLSCPSISPPIRDKLRLFLPPSLFIEMPISL